MRAAPCLFVRICLLFVHSLALSVDGCCFCCLLFCVVIPVFFNAQSNDCFIDALGGSRPSLSYCGGATTCRFCCYYAHVVFVLSCSDKAAVSFYSAVCSSARLCCDFTFALSLSLCFALVFTWEAKIKSK